MRAIVDIPYEIYLRMKAEGRNVVYIKKYDESEKLELERRLREHPRAKELRETIKECREEIKQLELDEWDRILFDREPDTHTQ